MSHDYRRMVDTARAMSVAKAIWPSDSRILDISTQSSMTGVAATFHVTTEKDYAGPDATGTNFAKSHKKKKFRHKKFFGRGN